MEDTSVELKKYHIIEYLMNCADLKLLEKVEKMILNAQSISKKEMLKRAAIAENQLKEGNFKTNDQAKERLSKWIK